MSCLVSAVLCCGMFCFGEDDLVEYPAADCGASTLQMTASCCNNKQLTRVRAWCEGSIGAYSVPKTGKEVWIVRAEMKHNCPPACGDAEKENPQPITAGLENYIEFTDAVEESIEAGIAGGTFLVGIKAELKAGVAATKGFKTTVGQSLSVTLPACKWQVLEAKLRIIEGKEVNVTASIGARAEFTCPHISPKGLLLVKAPMHNVTATATVDKAVSGTGWSGTKDNGTCPPDPPEVF